MMKIVLKLDYKMYDYIIINELLKKAIYDFECIVNANLLKQKKQIEKIEKILESWEGK